MKTLRKSVKSDTALAKKSDSGHCSYEGTAPGRYTRTRFKNPQGRREEVMLLDLQEETMAVENMLSYTPNLGLRHDLTKAFGMFTLKEQTILHRILVQRMSLVQATKRFKSKSRRAWARWYKEKALTKLRRVLKDYRQNGKVVV